MDQRLPIADNQGAFDVAESTNPVLIEARDVEIRYDIEHAIANDEVLRRIDLPALRIHVDKGTVVLAGNVATRPHGEQIETIARKARGVENVLNHLFADDDLELAVAQALGKDLRTRSGLYRVSSSHGIVGISTQLRDERSFEAAQEISSAVPGVRAVTVMDPESREQPTAFLPAIGTSVYASDGALGKLTQVIISRHSRQVLGLIVDAVFHKDAALDLYGDAPPTEHLVVVATNLIVHATPAGVFLGIELARAARLPLLMSEDYDRPDETWRPSSDYRSEEVCFPKDPEASP